MVISSRKSDTSATSLRRVTMCVLGAAVLAASCSSSSDESASTTIAGSTIAPVTTERAASTSTVVATTAELPATTQTTPPTTIDPVVSADVAVRDAVARAQATFSACLVALPLCDPATLAVARAGDLLARNTTLIVEWNSLGYTVRDRDQFRFVVESVVVDPSLATAVATVCIADGSRLVLPNAAPDGSDVVIDDEYTSGRSEWDMRLDADGAWRLHDSTPIGVAETVDVCGAA